MLVLPNKTGLVWNHFVRENKSLVYKYMVRQVLKELESENEEILLFRFEDNSMKATLLKKDIPHFLNDALQHFIKNEEYENAGNTNKVIQQYHINKLIEESKLP